MTLESSRLAKIKCRLKNRAIPEYRVWERMLSRCEKDSDDGAKFYKHKGITVSEAWHTFKVFYADMGSRPTSKHEIDRIDNAKGYSKENCRWVTHRDNCLNTSTNFNVAYKNLTKPLMQWCIELGFEDSYHTYKRRLYRGWDAARTFETPIKTRGII